VTVFARDRIGEATYGTDTAVTKITYKPLGDHPAPSIATIGETDLYPLCQPYQSKQGKYQINPRSACPAPTGITGLIVWGSLPSGLTFYDSMAGNYFAPYSNLSGGYISVQGYPLSFANGGTYQEKLSVAVVDARGKSGVIRDITFKDVSAPIEPSPTDITLYFANSGYYYSPALGQQQSGTNIVLNQPQIMLRPPPAPISMDCLSRLPHNKCLYSTGLYSIIDSNTIRLSGYGTSVSLPSNKVIGSNHRIYVEFDDQISSIFDKEYIASRIDNNIISITSSGHGIDPSFSGLVKILKTQDNIIYTTVNDAVYGGNPGMSVIDTTTTGLLGGGEFKTIQNIRGFVGRMKPSLIASLSSGIYRTNSTYLEDFNINPLDGENNHQYTIKFVNCYETGYFRVSGIILPSPSLESTDPPPGGGKNYSYNNQGAIAVAIRSSYGSTDIEKQIAANKRSLSTNYSISNIIDNIIQQSGNVATDAAGIGSFIFSPPNLSYGTVYSLYLQYISPIQYPTYDKFAIPSLNNIYYWIHKAGNELDIPDQQSFPPVIPVENNRLLFVSGNNPNKTITLVGGFIPNPALQFPYGNWNYEAYPPHATGYMQKTLPVYTGTYSKPFNNQDVNLVINNSPFVSGSNVMIKFKSFDGYEAFPTAYSGISLSSITGNFGVLRDGVPSNFRYSTYSGSIEVTDMLSIVSGENPYEIKVFHRSGLKNEFAINNHIDLINVFNKTTSVQGNIFPNNYRLNIISGTNTYSYAAINSFVFSGTLTSGSYTITNCSTNPLNILNTGVKLYSATNSLPDNHLVSGITTDTITLTEPYNGETTNNVLIYFSGYPISGYYSNMIGSNGTGLCEFRSNIYSSGNNQEFILNRNNVDSNGKSIFNISGIPLSLGSYIYRIITSENSGLPLVTGATLWSPKKYGKDYSLTTTTPPIIVAPSATVSIVNNSWTYSFAVTGGYTPRKDRFLEIELGGYIHTFNRTDNIVSDSGMLITLTSKPGFNWSQIFETPLSLKVYDETGYDLEYINAVY